jgi:hypothetical protein
LLSRRSVGKKLIGKKMPAKYMAHLDTFFGIFRVGATQFMGDQKCPPHPCAVGSCYFNLMLFVVLYRHKQSQDNFGKRIFFTLWRVFFFPVVTKNL